jgi:hypothetical protein
VKDGRGRSIEVRKVDGEVIDPKSPIGQLLERVGFTHSYRGMAFRA